MENQNDYVSNNETQNVNESSPNNTNNPQVNSYTNPSYSANNTNNPQVNNYTNPSYSANNNNSGYNSGYNNGYNNNPIGYNQYNQIPNIMVNLSGWMKFMGIYTIIVGAITCIGVITAAIGVPMIFSGISLNNASKNLKMYSQHNNEITLNYFFTYLHKYFKIQGIFTIISISISILYVAILFISLFMVLLPYGY